MLKGLDVCTKTAVAAIAVLLLSPAGVAAADTLLFGEASSFASAPSPNTTSDTQAFNTGTGVLTADPMTSNSAMASTFVSISQNAVPGETLTTEFSLSASLNTASGPSGSNALSLGIVHIRVENPTTYTATGSITMTSTNGTGAANLFLRRQPPGPFIYINGNTGATSLITEPTTFNFSDTNSMGVLMPNVNYQLEWNWQVSRAFGRDPISANASFQLTLVEDISLLLGDLDGDGYVGISDMDLLLADWGMAGSPADADGSGTVGQGDLNIVIANWGSGQPPTGIIPEPNTLAIVGLAGVVLLRRRRCRAC